MFARVSTVFMLSFVALIASVSALPHTAGGPGGHGTEVTQCNTGTLQCCNSVQHSSLFGLGDLGLVGKGCSSILGGSSCTAQPACCSGNTFHGGLLNCSPININL